MTLEFVDYTCEQLANCLALFDANCPEYFAENERADYMTYLDGTSDLYKVGLSQGRAVAVFGIANDQVQKRARITWIMVCPKSHGQGYGVGMMEYAIKLAADCDAQVIDIAASHLSAPFFEKFGAIRIKTTMDGWGPDMHKVDMEMTI